MSNIPILHKILYVLDGNGEGHKVYTALEEAVKQPDQKVIGIYKLEKAVQVISEGVHYGTKG